jgi:hypothetical protein
MFKIVIDNFNEASVDDANFTHLKQDTHVVIEDTIALVTVSIEDDSHVTVVRSEGHICEGKVSCSRVSVDELVSRVNDYQITRLRTD